MHFISGVVPEELQRHITLEDWQDIVSSLMQCEEKGQDCACWTSFFCLVAMPLTCPFLCCFQDTIQSQCVKRSRRMTCDIINIQYFKRRRVFRVGEGDSIHIHYDVLMDNSGAKHQKLHKSGVPVAKAMAVPIDRSTIPSTSSSESSYLSQIQLDEKYRVSAAQLASNTEANAGRENSNPARSMGKEKRRHGSADERARQSVVRFAAEDEISPSHI